MAPTPFTSERPPTQVEIDPNEAHNAPRRAVRSTTASQTLRIAGPRARPLTPKATRAKAKNVAGGSADGEDDYEDVEEETRTEKTKEKPIQVTQKFMEGIYNFMKRQEIKNRDQDKMIKALRDEVIELNKVIQNLQNTVVEKVDQQQANNEDLRLLIKTTATPVSPEPSLSAESSSSASGNALAYANALKSTAPAKTPAPLPTRDTLFRTIIECEPTKTIQVGAVERELRRRYRRKRDTRTGSVMPSCTNQLRREGFAY